MNRVFPASVVIIGLVALYPLQRWIDSTTSHSFKEEEALYLPSGKAIKRLSLGLDGLAADVYWIRTVQYFGRKLSSEENASARSTGEIPMPLLAPLLNIVVTLDPHNIQAYSFGAIFLPERDMPAAIALLEKGINENPEAWRLYKDLAYIYWQQGNRLTGAAQDEAYAKAAEWYEKGSEIPDAMWWMRDLAGLMRIKGGTREAARAIYRSYLDSEDKNIASQAVERLKQLQALDELDAINGALAAYREQNGACPGDLRVLAPRFRSLKLSLNENLVPVDPDGFAYVYDRSACAAKLAFQSTISR
jgi:tetratricopeptide (TPR) repeat protein